MNTIDNLNISPKVRKISPDADYTFYVDGENLIWRKSANTILSFIIIQNYREKSLKCQLNSMQVVIAAKFDLIFREKLEFQVFISVKNLF